MTFDPLTEPAETPARESIDADVTISVDLEALTRHYLGTDDDGDDHYDRRAALSDRLMEMAARHLASQIGRDWKTEIKRQVSDMFGEIARERIEQIVTETFASDLQKTDGFGNPVGPPVNVGAMIADIATKWFNEETGDYSRRQKRGLKVINEFVDAALKEKVKEAVISTEQQTIALVSQHAGKLLTKAVQELVDDNKIQLT